MKSFITEPCHLDRLSLIDLTAYMYSPDCVTWLLTPSKRLKMSLRVISCWMMYTNFAVYKRPDTSIVMDWSAGTRSRYGRSQPASFAYKDVLSAWSVGFFLGLFMSYPVARPRIRLAVLAGLVTLPLRTRSEESSRSSLTWRPASF
jgi:hypothetical protein